jgi:hypothetical protein
MAALQVIVKSTCGVQCCGALVDLSASLLVTTRWCSSRDRYLASNSKSLEVVVNVHVGYM